MIRLKRLVALILIACGLSSLTFVFSYIKYMRPRIISISQKVVENEVSNIIDHEIKRLMLSEFLRYDKITDISRDADGKVTSISTNSVLINNFANELDIKIGNKIDENSVFENKVYLSSLIGFDLLSGFGPKIPIRLEQLSATHADISHTFEETAINQTLHTIILSVSIDVEILIPFAYSSITVESQMPIAQTLIVGSVPDAYFDKK